MVKPVGDESGAGARGADVHGNLARDVFLAACRKQSALNAETKALRTRVKDARAQFKADGVSLGKMDAAIKMVDWSRAEVRDDFDTARKYAEWLGLPVGTQTELFSTAADANLTPDMEDGERIARGWHAAGRSQRLAGKERQLPDECGAKNVLFFDNGYALKDFIWVRESAGAAPTDAGGGGEAPAKPARKPGRPAKEKAAQVAGAISPPPAKHTKESEAAALKVVGGTDGAAGGDTMPATDGFGETGFGAPGSTH